MSAPTFPAFPVPTTPAGPVTRPGRSTGGVVGIGLLVGTATGAGIGTLTAWALIAVTTLRAYSGPEIIAVLFLYGAIAGLIGGAVGLADAAVTVLVLVAARRWIGSDRWRGRLTAAAGASLSWLALGCTGTLTWAYALPFTVACSIGAVSWARVILGLRRTP